MLSTLMSALRAIVLASVLSALGTATQAQLCPPPATVTPLPTTSASVQVAIGSGVTIPSSGGSITNARVFRVVGTGHRYRVTTCGLTTQDTILAVTNSCAAPWLGQTITVGDDQCSSQSQIEFDAREGVEYNIVAGWYSSAAQSYQMTITRLAAIASTPGINATCATATPLLFGDARGNELVVSAAQPQGSWYVLTIQDTTSVTLRACALVGDPLIEILVACGGSLVTSNDDGGGPCAAPFRSSGGSQLTVTLTPGSYIVRAGSYNGVPTTGLLTATVALPAGVLSYQGRLEDQGQPANGVFDIRFDFYSGPNTTTRRGTFDATGVVVTNGLFTVELPYLAIPGVSFDTDRFIELSAKRSDQTAYVTLLPRQQIGIAPIARVALNAPAGPQGPQGGPGPAGPAGAPGAPGAPGTPGSSPFTLSGTSAIYTAGNLGIGTAAPNARLGVEGTDASTGLSLNIANNLFATPGYVGVGRSAPQTAAERFGIGSSVGGYTGMYITTPNGGLPFYGYISGSNTAWTYLDTQNVWRLYNTAAGEIFAIAGNGNTGIKVSPSTIFTLDVGGNIRCTTLTQTSSGKYKDEVTTLRRGLVELMDVRPVEFIWNDQSPADVRTKHDVGVIAEELATVLPEAVTRDAAGAAVGVDYSRLTVLSIKAIQELREINQRQQQLLLNMEERLRKLEAAPGK